MLLVRMWRNQMLHTGDKAKWSRPWDIVWWFLEILNMQLLYNLEIALGTDPIKSKICRHPKSCPWMFIAIFIDQSLNLEIDRYP